MSEIIIISGAPGSGKTTISNLLRKKLKNSPLIDFGWLREYHLDAQWKKANEKEEAMSFENLIFILKNYLKHGYKNIIVNDLQDYRIIQIPKIFSKHNYKIISLLVNNDSELKRRVLSKRDSGFKNTNAAQAWNNKIIRRKNVKNEYKIDNTHRKPEKTVAEILKIIK